MAKIENYNGSVSLIAGITQKGGGDFALVEANAVQTREDGTRLDAELEEIQNNKVDKVEGEGLSETKSVETYSEISSMLGGTVTSPIRMPEVEDFIYIVSQDGRHSTLALYNSTQIDNIITAANAAFGTRISYKTITDDVFDETLNAGWYKITSADETKNYISTWMLVTRITNDYHTSKDVIPIARQIIFGEGSIKHRTYFGRVKQFEETIIQPWSIDAKEESADVSTFAALSDDRTEYLDTYWSDWEIGATQGYVEDRISDSIENKEDKANKVTVLSENSTDDQYPSALAVYNVNNALVLADERLKYYGDKDIVPSDENYFTVSGNAITGLTETGKTQTGTLVIPYKINGKIITTLASDNMRSILDGATDQVSKVILPNSITNIGSDAFDGCTALTSINIPNSVTSIGSLAFNGCSSLTSINIPNSVTSIGNGAFGGCTSLTSINIPNSVTSINSTAFYGCTNLTIYCEQGSYADTYAKENNIPIVYTDVKATSINPTVKTALEEITTVNTIYDLGVQTELVITLPSGQVGDFIQFDFISGSTATDLSVNPPTTLTVNSSSGLVGFDLSPGTNTIYTLYFDWGVTGYDGTGVTYGWRFNYSEYSVDVV